MGAGGKTAALKTLGLMALMAKAGLFLPVQIAAPASSSNGSQADDTSSGPPRLQWFSQVLADVGDSQDLQQSLSTFSGHVKRLGRILGAVDSRSLVLLDEVGVAPCSHT